MFMRYPPLKTEMSSDGSGLIIAVIEAAPYPQKLSGREARRLPSMTSVESLVLLTVATVHLLAAMSSGPNFITLSRTAPASGRSAGLASALACGLRVLPWAIGAILGIMIVFNQAPWLYAVLKTAS